MESSHEDEMHLLRIPELKMIAQEAGLPIEEMDMDAILRDSSHPFTQRLLTVWFMKQIIENVSLQNVLDAAMQQANLAKSEVTTEAKVSQDDEAPNKLYDLGDIVDPHLENLRNQIMNILAQMSALFNRLENELYPEQMELIKEKHDLHMAHSAAIVDTTLTTLRAHGIDINITPDTAKELTAELYKTGTAFRPDDDMKETLRAHREELMKENPNLRFSEARALARQNVGYHQARSHAEMDVLFQSPQLQQYISWLPTVRDQVANSDALNQIHNQFGQNDARRFAVMEETDDARTMMRGMMAQLTVLDNQWNNAIKSHKHKHASPAEIPTLNKNQMAAEAQSEQRSMHSFRPGGR